MGIPLADIDAGLSHAVRELVRTGTIPETAIHPDGSPFTTPLGFRLIRMDYDPNSASPGVRAEAAAWDQWDPQHGPIEWYYIHSSQAPFPSSAPPLADYSNSTSRAEQELAAYEIEIEDLIDAYRRPGVPDRYVLIEPFSTLAGWIARIKAHANERMVALGAAVVPYPEATGAFSNQVAKNYPPPAGRIAIGVGDVPINVPINAMMVYPNNFPWPDGAHSAWTPPEDAWNGTEGPAPPFRFPHPALYWGPKVGFNDPFTGTPVEEEPPPTDAPYPDPTPGPSDPDTPTPADPTPTTTTPVTTPPSPPVGGDGNGPLLPPSGNPPEGTTPLPGTPGNIESTPQKGMSPLALFGILGLGLYLIRKRR